jgi:hypothetical protein
MRAAWNLLVYAIADDHLPHAKIIETIAQMRGALTSRACNVVVQLHAKTSTTRHWLAAGKRPRVEKVIGPGVDDPASLTAFIDAAHRAQPAEATALVLLAHRHGLDNVDAEAPDHRAGGAPTPRAAAHAELPGVFERTAANHNLAAVGRREITPGVPAPARQVRRHVARDPRTGKLLHNVDLRKAIARSLQKRVQVLGLNACLMASLEIQYELRDVAELQIASQVYDHPWPYGAIVGALVHVPAPSPVALATAIVATVRDAIQRDPTHADPVTAFRAGAALEGLVAAFDPLAVRARKLVDADWPAISKLVAHSDSRVVDPYEIDLRSFVEALADLDATAAKAAAAFLRQLAAVIVDQAESAGVANAHGLSIFCPPTGEVDLAEAYRELQFRTRPWAAFLRAYQARLRSRRDG